MGNYASRLLAILEAAQHQALDKPSTEVWADLLDVRSASGVAADYEIARRLGYLHRQLVELRELLSGRVKNMGPFDLPLRRAEAALSVRGLGANWKGVRDHVTTDTLASFGAMAQLLEDDDWPAVEVLADLISEADRIEAEIEHSNLPDELKQFLSSQLLLIRRAARESRYRGPEAFVEASDRASEQWLANEPMVQQYEEHEPVRAVRGLWPRIRGLGRSAKILSGFAIFYFCDLPQITNGMHSLITAIHVQHDPPRIAPPPTDVDVRPDSPAEREADDDGQEEDPESGGEPPSQEA